MANRLARISSSPLAAPIPDRRHGEAEPMLPALVRGVVFIAVLAAPFLAALLTG
ncbi:hypothetical protein [Bradyrhizobium canariense]|uniref:hypothetical protein n=1 Tax=Bradyrhizobium canariense TaxID=255045 RepID=UPI001CA4801F|nr:hypothetical protein [Bradyrhizobium canariense]